LTSIFQRGNGGGKWAYFDTEPKSRRTELGRVQRLTHTLGNDNRLFCCQLLLSFPALSLLLLLFLLTLDTQFNKGLKFKLQGQRDEKSKMKERDIPQYERITRGREHKTFAICQAKNFAVNRCFCCCRRCSIPPTSRPVGCHAPIACSETL